MHNNTPNIARTTTIIHCIKTLVWSKWTLYCILSKWEQKELVYALLQFPANNSIESLTEIVMNRQQTSLIIWKETIEQKNKTQPYMKIHKSVWLSGRRLVVIWCNLLDLSKMYIDWNCCTQKQLFIWYEIIWQLTAVSRCIMTTNWWNEWQILQCRHGTFNAWIGNSLIEVLRKANTTK